MRNKTDWGRILIGLLLLLNALPFSGGREIRLGSGIFYIVAGWALLSWPVIANSFYGPTDSDARKFGLADVIKIAVSACMLFWSLFSRGTDGGSSLPVILFALGVVILFVPLEPIYCAWNDRSAEDLRNLDELKAGGVIDEEEYIKLKEKIIGGKNRQR